MIKPRQKKTTPVQLAMMAIILIKESNSLFNVVSSAPEFDTRSAI
jgi:hypothetical protein